jgi:hypothetical protein
VLCRDASAAASNVSPNLKSGSRVGEGLGDQLGCVRSCVERRIHGGHFRTIEAGAIIRDIADRGKREALIGAPKPY